MSLNIFEKVWYRHIQPKIDLHDYYREVKWFLQRGRRGWADSDAWSIDWYLDGWLPDALRRLKKRSPGCPGSLWDKKRKGNECWKWNQVLEEIAQGFEAHRQMQDFVFPYGSKRYKKAEAKFNNGMKLFTKWYGGLWD